MFFLHSILRFQESICLVNFSNSFFLINFGFSIFTCLYRIFLINHFNLIGRLISCDHFLKFSFGIHDLISLFSKFLRFLHNFLIIIMSFLYILIGTDFSLKYFLSFLISSFVNRSMIKRIIIFSRLISQVILLYNVII